MTPLHHECRYEESATERRIVTEFGVRVEEVWRGSSLHSPRITLLGGRVGDLAQKVPGEAILQDGVSALLFLGPDRGGYQNIVGMAQGQFDVSGGTLRKSRALPAALRRPRGALQALATDELHGKGLAAARKAVLAAAD